MRRGAMVIRVLVCERVAVKVMKVMNTLYKWLSPTAEEKKVVNGNSNDHNRTVVTI